MPSSAGGSPRDRSADPIRIHDQGMQAERTRLAWARTSLAVAVIGALELHIGRAELALLDRLPGLLMLLMAVGCWIYGGRRYLRITRALTAGDSVLDHRQGLVLAGLSLLPAAIAIWSVLV